MTIPAPPEATYDLLDDAKEALQQFARDNGFAIVTKRHKLTEHADSL
jgi:hypothetical protein